jgi:hypothetical protein
LDNSTVDSTNDHVPINNFVPATAAGAAVAQPNVAIPANVPPLLAVLANNPPQIFQTYAAPVVNDFDTCLQRLALMPQTIQQILDQGFAMIAQLRHVPFESMDNTVHSITKLNVIPLGAWHIHSLYYHAGPQGTALDLYLECSNGINSADFKVPTIILWQLGIGHLEHVTLEL